MRKIINFLIYKSRIRGKHCCCPLSSEPCVQVSPHTAQAFIRPRRLDPALYTPVVICIKVIAGDSPVFLYGRTLLSERSLFEVVPECRIIGGSLSSDLGVDYRKEGKFTNAVANSLSARLYIQT